MIENLSAIKQYIVWPAQRNGLTTIYFKLYALNFQNQKYMYKKKNNTKMYHELYQIIDHSTRMKWPKVLLPNIMTLRKQLQSDFKQMIKLNWVADKLQMEAKKKI